MSDIVKYYKRQAEDYEESYEWSDPNRQEEQELIGDAIIESLRLRRVLEVACGAGYWTRVLSESAGMITATDIGEEVMELAKRKRYHCPVHFRKENAYDLSFDDASFDGGFAFSWFSHIPRNRIDPFLKGFHRVLQDGSRVFIADNIYIQAIGGELIRKESDANTYKHRTLKDGSEFIIVKNYFSAEQLVEVFGQHVAGFSKENVFYGKCFWYVDYVLH
jgi:ubiquinone/menaquinone biosynthesis C-methylase UbiE